MVSFNVPAFFHNTNSAIILIKNPVTKNPHSIPVVRRRKLVEIHIPFNWKNPSIPNKTTETAADNSNHTMSNFINNNNNAIPAV